MLARGTVEVRLDHVGGGLGQLGDSVGTPHGGSYGLVVGREMPERGIDVGVAEVSAQIQDDVRRWGVAVQEAERDDADVVHVSSFMMRRDKAR